ncbi:uncharacterized protein PSFLO_05353 [Pseudozyma flocculosa]|uniref:Uncharacterized protein n=1 Tax=Pseudozyma flocculosa TaxID=84751 RepID=A0A5C3F665_9BASI|nr:uncharacterized protein PSFLO_05353 [Pseudozyma flocculosa]
MLRTKANRSAHRRSLGVALIAAALLLLVLATHAGWIRHTVHDGSQSISQQLHDVHLEQQDSFNSPPDPLARLARIAPYRIIGGSDRADIVVLDEPLAKGLCPSCHTAEARAYDFATRCVLQHDCKAGSRSAEACGPRSPDHRCCDHGARQRLRPDVGQAVLGSDQGRPWADRSRGRQCSCGVSMPLHTSKQHSVVMPSHRQTSCRDGPRRHSCGFSEDGGAHTFGPSETADGAEASPELRLDKKLRRLLEMIEDVVRSAHGPMNGDRGASPSLQSPSSAERSRRDGCDDTDDGSDAADCERTNLQRMHTRAHRPSTRPCHSAVMQSGGLASASREHGHSFDAPISGQGAARSAKSSVARPAAQGNAEDEQERSSGSASLPQAVGVHGDPTRRTSVRAQGRVRRHRRLRRSHDGVDPGQTGFLRWLDSLRRPRNEL